MTNPAQDPKKRDEGLKDKLKHTVDNFKKNEKVEDVVNYASSNTRDVIAYALLVAGLILMLTESFRYGATLIGVIFGLYFSDQIIAFLKNFRNLTGSIGMVHSLILAATLLALFIAVPFIFIGIAVALAVREFITNDKKPNP